MFFIIQMTELSRQVDLKPQNPPTIKSKLSELVLLQAQNHPLTESELATTMYKDGQVFALTTYGNRQIITILGNPVRCPDSKEWYYLTGIKFFHSQREPKWDTHPMFSSEKDLQSLFETFGAREITPSTSVPLPLAV